MRRPGSVRVVRRCPVLLRLPPREILTTFHVAVVLVFVEVLIRWVPLPRLAACSASASTSPRAGDVEQFRAELPRGRGAAALHPACRRRVAAQQGPCLRRSLVAGHLLRRARSGRAARRAPAPGTSCSPTPGSRSTIGRWRTSPDSRVRAARRRGRRESTEPLVYAQCGLRLRSEIELAPAASRPATAGTSSRAGGRTSTTRRAAAGRGHRRVRIRGGQLVHGDRDGVADTCCDSASAASS